MIYLDHAATSFPKPPEVYRAMACAASRYGANPGRGGYGMAVSTAEALYRVREEAAQLFGLSDPRRVVFMPSCTAALNTVIRTVADGGRVVISDLEHNAVTRPLYAASAVCDTAHVTATDDDATVAAFERAITPFTRAVVCTYVSNVTGAVLPVKRLAALAHRRGIPIVIDAAQAAGVLPIDVEGDALDYVCVAGHKGVYGPMGTGLLLCLEDRPLIPLSVGGTGSESMRPDVPDTLPERLESGTQNVPGLIGLGAGMRWVRRHGVEAIGARERAVASRIYEQLRATDGIRLHSPSPAVGTGVISFTAETVGVAALSDALGRGGFAVRGGFHCAPMAHRTLGTLSEGTVRLSVGAYTTVQEGEKFVQFLKKITGNPLFFRG